MYEKKTILPAHKYRLAKPHPRAPIQAMLPQK